MQITKVAPAVKTPGRYNIFVDDKYSFSLDELQLVQTGLHRGLEIDEERLEQLKNESNYGKEYIRALDLISRRPRSVKELRDYGRRKGWTPENTERVIQRLQDKGYQSDEAFAKMFATARLNAGRYSRRRIEQDLRGKGITSATINKVLDELDPSDLPAIQKLIAKRASRYDDESKLIRYLLSKGFSYDDVKKALAEYKENS